MKIIFYIIILFILNNCTVNNNYSNPTDNELTKNKLKLAELIGEVKATAKKSGENVGAALAQMKNTNYISEREFTTIYNNFINSKKLSNQIFLGSVCDANIFPTAKMRKLCFDGVLFYLTDKADEQLCAVQEIIYKEANKEFVCY